MVGYDMGKQGSNRENRNREMNDTQTTYGEFIADQLADEDALYDLGTDDFDPGNYAGWE